MRISFGLVPLTAIALASGAWAMADDGAAGVALQPGEWETTLEILDVTSSEPSLRDALMQPPTVKRSCISSGEVGPRSVAMPGCTENLRWSDGHISGTLTCTGANPGGLRSVIAMDGEYGPTHLRVDVKSVLETTSIETRLTGRRIGDCPEHEQDS